MIQPSVLSSLPGPPPLGEALPGFAAEGLEAADFGAFLAIETDGLAPPGVAAKLLVSPDPVAFTALPQTPVLPESGNPLPLALPVTTAEEIATPQPLPAPAPAAVRLSVQAVGSDAAPAPDRPSAPAGSLRRMTAPTAHSAAPARSIRSARPVPLVEPAPKPETSKAEAPVQPDTELAEVPDTASPPALAEQVTTPPAAAPSEPKVRPLELPFLAVAPAPRLTPEARPAPIAVIAAPQAPVAPPTGAEPREQPQPALQSGHAPVAMSVIAVPAQPAQRLAGTTLRLTLPTARSAAKIDGDAALIVQPQLRLSLPENGAVRAPDSAAALATEPRTPSIAITAERPRVPDKLAFAPLLAEPVNPANFLSAPPVQALSAPAALAPADPALRPHDFTQLVDRLVAARELAAPQAFQVAVQHGEFGQVQLRFHREGGALSVALASADPEFARVVSAAPAPVLPALPAETATQSGQRFDNQSQATASNGGSAQSRGGSPERRDDRHGPADNPASARQTEGRDPRRNGIFA